MMMYFKSLFLALLFLVSNGVVVQAAAETKSLSDNKVRRTKKNRARASGNGKGGNGKGKSVKVDACAVGAQEVPPVMTETTADLKLEFDGCFSELEYKLEIEQGVNVTQVHLHCGMAGTNGPVIATLYNVAPVPGPGGEDIDGEAAKGVLVSDDLTALTCGDVEISNIASLYEAILNRQVYVNVHTEANPPGEVRGQIFP